MKYMISTSYVLLFLISHETLHTAGKYIFEEPLQHYWAEKRAEEIAAKGDSPQPTSTISSDKTK